MSRIRTTSAGSAATPRHESPPATMPTSPNDATPSAEDRSKDDFFVRVAEVAEAMIAKHGKEFAIGTLVLSAKFIAEGKPLIGRANGQS